MPLVREDSDWWKV